MIGNIAAFEDRQSQSLACGASTLQHPLHTDFGLVAEFGRALFLNAEREMDQAASTR